MFNFYEISVLVSKYYNEKNDSFIKVFGFVMNHFDRVNKLANHLQCQQAQLQGGDLRNPGGSYDLQVTNALGQEDSDKIFSP